jgi:CheY-like chemotaxis protein
MGGESLRAFMKCPRCQSGIESNPDPAGFMVCPGCGARLRRTSAQTAQAVPASVQAGAMTLPPSDSPLGPRRVSAKAPAPAPAAGKATAASPRRVGDDTARVTKAAAAAAVVAPFSAPAANTPATASAVDAILAEVRAVRRMQEEILEILRGRADMGDAPASRSRDDFEGMQEPAVRSNRRKRVLLVDDDEATRGTLESVLKGGEVPVTTVRDGNSALASIAQDKPDVIVLELGIGGAMAGKDVVNMIKATMEWVDIPIILYTRVPMEGQKEARQIHGADDYVAKGPGGPEAVLAKAISFFRKP